MDSGNFGKIHHCTDLQDTTRKLVVKVSPNLRLIGKEVRALQHVGRDSVPNVISSGIIVSNLEPVEKAKEADSSIESVFADRKDFVAYYVMPRFGRNLEVLHAECNFQFSSDTILRIGAGLIDVFHDIHASGYTYNDLKLDNIVVGDASFSQASQHKLRLVDFGFA